MRQRLHQIALRLPAELIATADAIAARRADAAKRANRHATAHAQTRAAILREALERGLAALQHERHP